MSLFVFACSEKTPEEEAAERKAEAEAVLDAIGKAAEASKPLPFGNKKEKLLP